MDLLTSFGENRSLKGEKVDEDNVELSLGLSSNGRFGVNRLIRSSSIADSSDFSSERDETTSLTLYPPLTRTCSLPIETEAEWKKRKELESLRRSETKRRRVEKIKNGRGVKESPPSLLPPLPRPSPFPAQVSVGSPASGGSSGVSDIESQPPFSGANKDTELKSTASQQPISLQISSSTQSNSIPSHITSSQITNRNPSKNEALKMMFSDMPCVSTKGDGVNGEKIEGFLYRYRKSEEVRIVCVCHGSFLTPAEFIKHGGGGDVEHPLRHIVVIPPSV
ncbi:hypothetical protein SSX86_016211 [Deinandra increscens subsp. villosa]|uniref:Ninja-family protein n=1 Tax=Deinandra increscens subsp. villosa TaxID=3103831 RepID=A0AAP0GXV7_9ASTR